MTNALPKDPVSAVESEVIVFREFFEAFQTVGFTREEALQVLIAYMGAAGRRPRSN